MNHLCLRLLGFVLNNVKIVQLVCIIYKYIIVNRKLGLEKLDKNFGFLMYKTMG